MISGVAICSVWPGYASRAQGHPAPWLIAGGVLVLAKLKFALVV